MTDSRRGGPDGASGQPVEENGQARLALAPMVVTVRGDPSWDSAVEAAVSHWHNRCRILPDLAIPPIAAVMSILSPYASPSGIGLLVAMALWTVAADDLLDNHALPLEHALTILDECAQYARDPAPRPRDENPYRSALVEFESCLLVSPFWVELRTFWSNSFVRFVRASLYEYALASRLKAHGSHGHIPAIESYLSMARHSIALPWLLMSSLAFVPDASVAGSLPKLAKFATACGAAVRLANDLATHRRESEEGVVNAVGLTAARLVRMGESEERATASAEATVRARLRGQLGYLKRVAESPIAYPRVELNFLECTTFSVDSYLRRDFREWSPTP